MRTHFATEEIWVVPKEKLSELVLAVDAIRDCGSFVAANLERVGSLV